FAIVEIASLASRENRRLGGIVDRVPVRADTALQSQEVVEGLLGVNGGHGCISHTVDSCKFLAPRQQSPAGKDRAAPPEQHPSVCRNRQRSAESRRLLARQVAPV